MYREKDAASTKIGTGSLWRTLRVSWNTFPKKADTHRMMFKANSNKLTLRAIPIMEMIIQVIR